MKGGSPFPVSPQMPWQNSSNLRNHLMVILFKATTCGSTGTLKRYPSQKQSGEETCLFVLNILDDQ